MLNYTIEMFIWYFTWINLNFLYIHTCVDHRTGDVLLSWININPSMDTYLYPL